MTIIVLKFDVNEAAWLIQMLHKFYPDARCSTIPKFCFYVLKYCSTSFSLYLHKLLSLLSWWFSIYVCTRLKMFLNISSPTGTLQINHMQSWGKHLLVRNLSTSSSREIRCWRVYDDIWSNLIRKDFSHVIPKQVVFVIVLILYSGCHLSVPLLLFVSLQHHWALTASLPHPAQRRGMYSHYCYCNKFIAPGMLVIVFGRLLTFFLLLFCSVLKFDWILSPALNRSTKVSSVTSSVWQLGSPGY